MALGHQLIELPHADALNAAQLIDRTALGRLFLEADRIHSSDDTETSLIIERKSRLIE